MPSKNRIVIIGTGLAGLYTALRLSKAGLKSLLVTKGRLSQTNSWRAQGGIAAAYSKSDSTEEHLQDTLNAGDGLCDAKKASKIIEKAPEIITQFLEEGMSFDKDGDLLSYGKEGGHHKRRILHVSDQTGKAMHSLLIEKIKMEHKDNISLIENTMAYEASHDGTNYNLKLINTQSSEHLNISCSHLVLATGGAGKAFLYTSNWDGATGDGFKIANDLGCSLINAEFVQFHPTCLYHQKARRFLITEALRGEGAYLVNHKEERFMLNEYPQAELSPRDVVSLAIEKEIKTSGKDCVYLDIRHKEGKFIKERFPMIFKFCLEQGIDIRNELIPVVPAAHYFCGGIETDSSLVETKKSGLFVVGEAAYTGLHGANRLASNSLLECLVTADLCAEKISDSKSTIFSKIDIEKEKAQTFSYEDLYLINGMWDEVRALTWNKLGIRRSEKGLSLARSRLLQIEQELSDFSKTYESFPPYIELKSIIFYAKACIEGALTRTESRGSHYRVDFQEKSSILYNTEYYNGESSKKAL